jgi:nucleoside-diphosphate-sugar epimerase
MTDLKGKTALVTGSTSGIGKATASALAARGAHVLIVGRNEQRAKDAVAEINATLAPAMAERGWGAIVNSARWSPASDSPAWPCTAPAGPPLSC